MNPDVPTPSLQPGDRAPHRRVLHAPDAAVQRLRGSGGVDVRGDGPQKVFLVVQRFQRFQGFQSLTGRCYDPGVKFIAAVALATALLHVARPSDAKPEYTRKTTKACAFCHQPPGYNLNDAGKYYVDHSYSLKGYKPKPKASH